MASRVAAVALWAALIACVAFGQSQRPAPTPGKAGQAQQQNSNAPYQPASKNENDAKSSPIVVNVIQPQEIEEQKREKREERDEHATFERWTAISTIVIAAFTVILAISTSALWWDTRKSSDAARRAADAAASAAATAKSHLEYAHRARVSIRVGPIRFDEPGEVSINYSLHNSGEMPATNTAIFFVTGAETVAKLKAALVLMEDEEEQWGIVIAPKETLERKGDIKCPDKSGTEIAVVVSYVDGFDNRRMTWRRYVRGSGEWEERGSQQQ